MPSKYVRKREAPVRWRTLTGGKVQKAYVLPVPLVRRIDREARESGRPACAVAEAALRAGLARMNSAER